MLVTNIRHQQTLSIQQILYSDFVFSSRWAGFYTMAVWMFHYLFDPYHEDKEWLLDEVCYQLIFSALLPVDRGWFWVVGGFRLRHIIQDAMKPLWQDTTTKRISVKWQQPLLSCKCRPWERCQEWRFNGTSNYIMYVETAEKNISFKSVLSHASTTMLHSCGKYGCGIQPVYTTGMKVGIK